MEGKARRTVEATLARLASRAHGVVTRRQLLDSGVTSAEIEHRLRTGMLFREHRGVYRVGHRAPSVEARYMAAVLACGDGAVLSGRAAAHLLGIVKGKPPPPETIAPTERLLAKRAFVSPAERTTCRGIPVTTVPRTLVDLAAPLSADELALACHEAGVRYRTTPRQVKGVLARRPNAPGAAKLMAVMSGDVQAVLSKMERRFRQLLRSDRLELPESNRRAGNHRVDCRWPKHKLTVELDSYRYHNSRHSWVQDHKREREARARGDEFRRYIWDDVFVHSEEMLAELRVLLRSGHRR